VLDAILCPEWSERYYSFDRRWGPAQEVASMRNGCGDLWFCWFSAPGACLHGLAHESAMYRPGSPWPGIFDQLPSDFEAFRDEPAFDTSNTSFCIWRAHGEPQWNSGVTRFGAGPDPDGSAELLSILDGDPSTYVEHADSYFEVTIPRASVDAIYRHEALTPTLVASLNPEVSFDDLRANLDEIGYRVHHVGSG
jgi:hypothetical protein